jgi:REP element-mobilizing transposase RayT
VGRAPDFLQHPSARAEKVVVTKPRCVLPGVCYLITRRCSERRFFLRPDRKVGEIFEYLLGHLSKVYGIEIHAFVVMSNHYHLVITDTAGRLPDFQRDLNSMLARSINAFRGRWESFWDRKSYSAVALLEDCDLISKMGYTLTNPVKAKLVNRARHWEGATSAGMGFGQARVVARPEGFFGEEMPEFSTLELTRPSLRDASGSERVEELLAREVSRRETAVRKQGGKAMGMARVLKQDWMSRPATFERRRGLRPTIAGLNKWARIEALQRSMDWLREYKDALKGFVAGDREIEFPAGTWWMCARLECNRRAVA